MRMLVGIAGLTAHFFFCGCSAQNEIRPPAPVKGAALPKGALPATEIGYGEQVAACEQNALDKVAEKISALTEYKSPLFKKRDDFIKYIREKVLVDAGQEGKDVKALDNGPPFKSWIVTYRTDTDWWREIVRRDHEAHRKLVAASRQAFASRIILGLGLLLLAGVGYVRLDEYTQRRYTSWLRVAGLGVATSAIAGWWWLFFQVQG